MPKGSNPPPAHLTRQERQQLRDQIALRVLPYCCLQARNGYSGESLKMQAEIAAEHAYVIADAMLSQRGIDDETRSV